MLVNDIGGQAPCRGLFRAPAWRCDSVGRLRDVARCVRRGRRPRKTASKCVCPLFRESTRRYHESEGLCPVARYPLTGWQIWVVAGASELFFLPFDPGLPRPGHRRWNLRWLAKAPVSPLPGLFLLPREPRMEEAASSSAAGPCCHSHPLAFCGPDRAPRTKDGPALQTGAPRRPVGVPRIK